MIDGQTLNMTYSSIAHQHTALLTLPDRRMPPMEADAAYQGCLPASYTVDHSLLVVQVHVILRLRNIWFTQCDLEIAHMWFMQSRDCAHMSCNPEIARAITGF